MIYTRFGSKVEVVEGSIEEGKIIIKRLSDGKEFDCTFSELKADNGAQEIIDAITAIGGKS